MHIRRIRERERVDRGGRVLRQTERPQNIRRVDKDGPVRDVQSRTDSVRGNVMHAQVVRQWLSYLRPKPNVQKFRSPRTFPFSVSQR